MNKITPTPWVLFDADRPGIDGSDGSTVILLGEEDEQCGIPNKANAEAIVSAINQTYGNGINPDSIPLYARLVGIIHAYYWNDLSAEHKAFVLNLIEQSKL